MFAMGTWGQSLDDSGKVEFFHRGDPPDTAPYLTIKALSGRKTYLIDAGAVGDLNGDGFIDWFVADANPYTNDPLHYSFYYGGPGNHDTSNWTWDSYHYVTAAETSTVMVTATYF